MNLKDIIIPAILAFAITSGIRYFIEPSTSNNDEVVSGKKRKIVLSEDMVKPFNKDINFLESSSTDEPEETNVKIFNGNIVFTSEGAAIKHVCFDSFNNDPNDICVYQAQDIKQRGFILALDKPSPINYKLVKNIRMSDLTELIYQAEIDGSILTKTFEVYHDKNEINLTISMDSKESDNQYRLFIPVPFIQGTEMSEQSGIVNSSSSNTKINTVKNNEVSSSWDIPYIFGAQSRYFASVVFNEDGDRSQRGSFKTVDGRLISILETPRVKGDFSWKISSYYGPKQLQCIDKVDSKLDQILDYGWFGFISKILLKILNWIYNYVKNYGFSIILLTILLKTLILPITWNKDSAMKNQADLEKKMSYIRQKYKNDPIALEREQLELIKKSGFGGLSGILKSFIQLPLIIALQKLLINSIELYKAPFLWIPNLSAPDPYGILSIGIGIIMLVSMSANKKQSIKKILIPLGVMAMFVSFSLKLTSGLVLAIFINMIYDSLQSFVYRKFSK